jgi:hypothetical protein
MRWDARIGRRLKLHDLHVLLAVVQAGSVTLKERALGPVAELFIRQVRDVAKELAKGR